MFSQIIPFMAACPTPGDILLTYTTGNLAGVKVTLKREDKEAHELHVKCFVEWGPEGERKRCQPLTSGKLESVLGHIAAGRTPV